MEVTQLCGHSTQDSYRQLVTRYDHEDGVVWLCIKPVSRPGPCFTNELLAQMRRYLCY